MIEGAKPGFMLRAAAWIKEASRLNTDRLQDLEHELPALAQLIEQAPAGNETEARREIEAKLTDMLSTIERISGGKSDDDFKVRMRELHKKVVDCVTDAGQKGMKFEGRLFERLRLPSA